ncbi:MAG: LysR family transcriptional regulator, partial [Promethearchaeota archaeon]
MAKELEISQSTLSHQISQIEKEFGEVTLINRTTKKFELTKAGSLLQEHAVKIIELYDSCKREISKFHKVIEDII